MLAIVAGILVARHLKTPEDLGDSRPSPRTEKLISSAVQWADRIMNRIDGAGVSYRQSKRIWARYRGGGARLCSMATAGGDPIAPTASSFGEAYCAG